MMSTWFSTKAACIVVATTAWWNFGIGSATSSSSTLLSHNSNDPSEPSDIHGLSSLLEANELQSDNNEASVQTSVVSLRGGASESSSFKAPQGFLDFFSQLPSDLAAIVFDFMTSRADVHLSKIAGLDRIQRVFVEKAFSTQLKHPELFQYGVYGGIDKFLNADDQARFLPIDLQPGVSVDIAHYSDGKPSLQKIGWSIRDYLGLLNIITSALEGIDSETHEMYLVQSGFGSETVVIRRSISDDSVSVSYPRKGPYLSVQRLYGQEAKGILEAIRDEAIDQVSLFLLQETPGHSSAHCTHSDSRVPLVSLSSVYDFVSRALNIDPSRADDVALSRQAFLALLARHYLYRRGSDCRNRSCDVATISRDWEQDKPAVAARVRKYIDISSNTEWKSISEDRSKELSQLITEVPMDDRLQILANLPALAIKGIVTSYKKWKNS